MKFLSDILAKAGLTVDGVVTLNNTATGQTPDANDNSTKLATTAWVRTFVQPYSLPIASASVLGGIRVGSGLSINSGTGVLSVTGASAASIKSTQTFVVTEGQTVFTVTGGYTPGLIDIFLNGVYLSPNQTVATNGTTFTINDPAATGDIVDIIVSSAIFEGSATTTDQLPEGVVNLYYTDARARAAISLTVTGTSGASTYNSTTGVLNVPTYTLAGLGGVVSTRTITINGVTYDLTANRSWSALPVGGTAGQLLAKIDGTDYNAQWINEAPAASYTSQLKHRIKSSQAISKGQAVYVSSADGTNMIVSKASNATEGTSSKTMGLLESTVSTNGFANVITEGLLAGLDTTGANAAGDPVWLGTDGNLIYGLLNKPSAPAHLVFIGVVTRRNANNGEIFVKVQNGFEMGELHDYVQNGVQDNYVISYELSTNLYKPKSIATLLGYTPANAARSLTINGTSYDLTADRTWTLTTSNIAEGTNLYYTDTRVGTYLTANSYATQSYVSTQINNLVSGAPGLLDTLDELAAALGDDPNFATTVSTALSNRLRIDIGTQGLTSTQQGYGRTNLGLGSLATLSSIGDVYITDVAYSKLTGVPSTFAPSTHTHVWTDITDRPTNLSAFTNGPGYITGISFANVSAKPTTIAGYGITDSLVYTTSTYSNPSWITALAWSKITGAPAFITGYTETDTLASVTGRGATTTTTLTLAKVVTTGLYGPGTSAEIIPIWQYNSGNLGYGLAYEESSPDKFRIDVSGSLMSGTPDFEVIPNAVRIDGNTAWHAGNLTNLNQLTNGPGYITGYTEVDTLASVTSRGASTTASITVNGYLTVAGGADLNLKAASGNTDTGDIVFQDGSGNELHRLWQGSSTLNYRTNGGTSYQLWHTGNLTNLNQLTNGPGYITGYTETDTLSSVVSRGSSTSTGITINPNGTSITMGGGASAEGIRMQASTSTTYPVFLRSVNPSGGGETSAWIFKEAATEWGIWHNNPINTLDITRAPGTGIENNVGGGTNTVMIRLSHLDGSGQFTGSILNRVGTSILDQSGNIPGTAGSETLSTVTGRGGTTSSSITLSGAVNIYNTDSNDFRLYYQGAGSGSARVYYHQPTNELRIYATSASPEATTSIGSLKLYISSVYRAVLHEANYSSYALPLSGGTVTGTVTINGGAAHPLAVSSGQRYQLQIRNTNNSINSGYGWWWFTDTNFNMGFHADGAADRFTLTRDGNLSVTGSISTTGATIGRVVMDYDGNDSWFRMQSGNRMRITTTGGSDLIIPNTGSSITFNGSLVWHSGNLTNLNQLSNGPGYITNNMSGMRTFGLGSLGASGAQARRYEIARLGIDYNDWNSIGTFEVELHENYFGQGLKKVYNIWYGYVSNSGIRLVEQRGTGANNFRVVIGSEVVVSGDHRYLPVYVDVSYYVSCHVMIRTNRSITDNSNSVIGGTYIFTSPSGTNISDFGLDETVEFTTHGSASVPGNFQTTSGSSYLRVSGITNGSYIELSGNLPGHTNAAYPVIKSGGTIHFANNNKYSAYLEGNNTYFGIMNSGSSTTVFLNTNGNSYFTGGNLGIGTSNPSKTLHVYTTGNEGIFLQGTSGGVWMDMQTSGSQIHSIGAQVGGMGIYNRTSNLYRFFITDGGNVSIGTPTSADAKLHVYTGNPSGATSLSGNTAIAIDSNGNQYLEFRTRSDSAGIMQGILFTDNGRNAFIGFKEYTGAAANTYGESVHFAIIDFSASDAGSGFWWGTTTDPQNGVTSPKMFLRGNGNLNVGYGSDQGYKLAVNGTIYASGDVIAYSDISVKTNFRPIKNALNRLTKSRGIVYDRTDTHHKDNIGFIAQELEVEFPELINTNADGTKGVKYQNMVAVLTEAVKEQQTQIESQKSEIEELKDLVKQLINR
jgi:hypothetical protein